MADRYYAWIKIGGRLKAEDVDRFVEAVNNETQDQITSADLNGQSFLEAYADEANCGQFWDLETLCNELGLCFIRYSSSHYECVEEFFINNPFANVAALHGMAAFDASDLDKFTCLDDAIAKLKWVDDFKPPNLLITD